MSGKSFNVQSVIVVITISIVFAGVYSNIFDKKFDLNGDNANYYILGKALATGAGYINLYDIKKKPNNHFPPGYPVIISGIIKVFGDSPASIKVANGLFLLLTLIGLYFLVKQITNRHSTAIIVTLLVLLNSHILRYSTIIMTEIPFLFFTVITLLVFIRINYNKALWQDFYLILVIVMLAVSFYIRTSGITLILSILFFLLLTKRWRHAIVIAIGVFLLVLPWQLRNQNIGGSTYINQLSMVNPYRPELGNAGLFDYVNRLGDNISRYITKELPAATLAITKPDYRRSATVSQWLYGILFLTLIIFGIINLKKYKLLILTYLAGTLTILWLWPDVWVGTRFILPSVPFLLLGLVNGLQEVLLRFIPVKTNKLILWLPVVIAFLLISDIKTLHQFAKAEPGAAWANYFNMAKWAKANLPANMVIACRKPAMFYLYSNSYTVNYMYTENAGELMADLVKKQVDYVVMEQLGYSATTRYLYPVIQNNPEAFELVKELNKPGTYLFRFNDQ